MSVCLLSDPVLSQDARSWSNVGDVLFIIGKWNGREAQRMSEATTLAGIQPPDASEANTPSVACAQAASPQS